MIDPSNLLLFIAAGLALNLTPGPDMLYCATRATSQGKTAGLLSALGGGVGGLTHTMAAALGLSALLTYSATAFAVVKYAGVVYLVYLGIQMIRSGSGPDKSNRRLTRVSNWRLFSQGALTTTLNPKVAIFFLSFLPQFVDPARGSVALQFVILGAIFCTTGTTVNATVGLLFGCVGGWLESKPGFWKWQRKVSGSILIGLGLYLAIPEQAE